MQEEKIQKYKADRVAGRNLTHDERNLKAAMKALQSDENASKYSKKAMAAQRAAQQE